MEGMQKRDVERMKKINECYKYEIIYGKEKEKKYMKRATYTVRKRGKVVIEFEKSKSLNLKIPIARLTNNNEKFNNA